MNGTLIDLGANIGAICVPVCKQRSDVKVFAIEASKRIFSYLNGNILRNGIVNCIETIVSNYDYLSNKAKEDFENEFNFERAFEPIKQYLIKKNK